MAKKQLPTVKQKVSRDTVVHVPPAIISPITKQGSLSSMLGSRSRKDTDVLGVGGFTTMGGVINSKEVDPRLNGPRKYVTFSEILANTSIVAAGTRYFLNLLTKADWKVDPVDDTPPAKELAEKVEMIMGDMARPWHRVVRRGAMYRFYGFSIQEWTAKKMSDGSIGMFDIAPRPQSTIAKWDVDDDGQVIGVVQENPNTFEEIYLPRSKVIYHIDDSLNDSPEGLGLFRHLVSTSVRLRRYLELESWGFETDLHGIPIARAPLVELQQMVDSNALTPAQRTAVEKPIRDFINNHINGPKNGLLLDSMPYQTEDEKGTPSSMLQWDVKLLSASATSQEAVASAIERLNLEMARVLGTEHLLLGGDGRGSLALSRDKSHNFSLMVESTLREMRWTLDKEFLDPLWRLNGWPEELKPKLKTEAIQYRSIEEVTEALRDMAASGAMLAPDDPAINEVRQLLGLSDAPSESNLIDAMLGGGDDLPLTSDEQRLKDEDDDDNQQS